MHRGRFGGTLKKSLHSGIVFFPSRGPIVGRGGGRRCGRSSTLRFVLADGRRTCRSLPLDCCRCFAPTQLTVYAPACKVSSTRQSRYISSCFKIPVFAMLCEPWCEAPTADGTGNFNAKYYKVLQINILPTAISVLFYSSAPASFPHTWDIPDPTPRVPAGQIP